MAMKLVGMARTQFPAINVSSIFRYPRLADAAVAFSTGSSKRDMTVQGSMDRKPFSHLKVHDVDAFLDHISSKSHVPKDNTSEHSLCTKKTYLDSGATHCWVKHSNFVDYTPVTNRTGQAAKEGAHFEIHGTGSVQFDTSVKGIEHTIILKGVLYTPELSPSYPHSQKQIVWVRGTRTK